VISLLCTITLLYEVAIFGRMILSWFPLAPGGFGRQVNGWLIRITEPVIGPLRRVLPRTGMLDLSPTIVVLVLQIVVRGMILRC
jgi:YggT family protein